MNHSISSESNVYEISRGSARRAGFRLAVPRRSPLESTENRYANIVESTPAGLLTASLDGIIQTWNPACERLFGYKAAEVIGRSLKVLAPPDRTHEQVSVFQQMASGTAVNLETRRLRKDGTLIDVLFDIAPIRDSDGLIASFVATVRDITDRKRLADDLHHTVERLGQRIARRTRDLNREKKERRETQAVLCQLQKIEAVGQLASGLAHDFNNMLAVIRWNVERLESRLGPEEPDLRHCVEDALEGVHRATALAQQLLNFARRQPLQATPVDVNRLVLGMKSLLGRTLGGNVVIETTLMDGLWSTLADSNQLENALLNLAVNARDAMPAGGQLRMETAHAVFDEKDAAANTLVTAGDYVMLTVVDTGTGMTAEVASRVFEPFFTTKAVGQGTGLGLSQVNGFVRQLGGHVTIFSKPGGGTAVTLYLPRLAETGRPDAPGFSGRQG